VDFIIRHYEKLILMICLLLLLMSLHIVSKTQDEMSQQTADVNKRTQPETIVRCDKMVEELDTATFPSIDEILASPLTKVELAVSPNGAGRTGLLEGGNLVICKNTKCGYILPYSANICPWCNTTQEAIGPETTETDDLDQDGIPDLVEKATTFLHYRYPLDAMMDADQDGFLNIEEYRAGTAMDDPESKPALAYLLRVASAEQEEIPVTLRRIKQNGSANPKDWKANVEVTGEPRPVDVKMGAAIPKMNGFKLTAFDKDNNSITISNDTESYVIVAGAEKIRKPVYTIVLQYLGNHIYGAPVRRITVDDMIKEAEEAENLRRNPRRGMFSMQQGQGQMDGTMGMQGMMGAQGMQGQMGGMMNSQVQGDMQLSFTITPGTEFVLRKSPAGAASMLSGTGRNSGLGNNYGSSYGADDEAQETVEYYQMLDLGTDAKGEPVVQVQKLTFAGGAPEGEPITIRPLDKTPYAQVLMDPANKPNLDFMPPSQATGSNAMGNMGGGMPQGGALMR
jgi:hypothetical protein